MWKTASMCLIPRGTSCSTTKPKKPMAITPSSVKDGPQAKVKLRNLVVLAALCENLPKGDRKLTTTENLNRITINEKYQVEKTLGFAAL